jgi:hypothetical protein
MFDLKKLISIVAFVLLFAAAPVAAVVCIAPEGPPGTTELVPGGCGYLGLDPFVIQDGFPGGTDIQIDVEIVSLNLVSSAPGGGLGGEAEDWTAGIELTMSGTGTLSGFNRFITVPLIVQTHSGPRTPGDAVQVFPTDMFSLEGDIFGDPDFDFLRIEAGPAFGLPSPGAMTLTDLGGGNWNIDSFFDVAYRIDFQGAPGSVLDGFGGPTEGSAGIQMGEPQQVPTNTAWGRRRILQI